VTLAKLGEILDRLKRRGDLRARRLAERMAQMMKKGEWTALRELALRTHLDSQLTAWALHATWLDLPFVPPIKAQELLLERSVTFGDTVVARAAAVLPEAGKGLRMDPRLYLRLIVDVATRRGWTEGAEQAGREAGAMFKTWVRVYPVKEPRDWHSALEGTTIPEKGKFTLPGGPNRGQKVDAPHDWDSVPDPREWVNCGHAVIYTRQATWRDLGAR